jgi:hypothetical protein
LTNLLVATLLVACARVPHEQVPAFRNGVATAKRQVQESFVEVNSAVREAQLDGAPLLPALSEDRFPAPLLDDDVARWSKALSLIEAYAAALQQLLAPEQRAVVEQSLKQIGEQIQRQSSDVPAGVAAAFQRFGGAMTQIYAEQEALSTVRRFDPHAQEIFRSLAMVIGGDAQSGIRATVSHAWSTRLTYVESEFLDRAQSSAANARKRKREVAARYVAMMELRAKHDASLVALQESLLALADAHAAIAAGDEPSAEALLAIVRDEYQGFQQAQQHFEKLRAEAGGRAEEP